MKIIQKLAFLSLTTLSIVSCNKKEITFNDPLLTNRDTTINPSDNFFKYANGGWIKKHPIPASEKGNGIFRIIKSSIITTKQNLKNGKNNDE